jgi:hypothetical protein
MKEFRVWLALVIGAIAVYGLWNFIAILASGS